MKYFNRINIILSLFLLIQTSQINAQKNDLYDFGEKITNILQSDSPEKISDFTTDKNNLDFQANVLKSFLVIKKTLEINNGNKKFEFFNIIKKDNNKIIILKSGNKFMLIGFKSNDNNEITDSFRILSNSIADRISLGEKVFNSKCFACHGKYGKGSIAPNLTDNYWIHVISEKEIIKIIRDGKKGTTIMPYRKFLKPEEINAVMDYIKAIHNKKIRFPKEKQGRRRYFDLFLLKKFI